MDRVRTGLAGLAIAAALAGAVQAAEPVAAGWVMPAPTIVNPARNTDKSGWEKYKARKGQPAPDQHLDDPMLKGAIDIHAHYGPDTYARAWDAFEIAKLAQARGMRGVVLKSHWTESASLAFLVRKHAAPGFEAFGALTLNSPVGGINPNAVRHFAEMEGGYGKVVWMPTHDSEHEVKFLKEARPFVRVSQDGVLLPEVLEVLDLMAEHHLTLATGHVSPAEMLLIVAEARKRGVDRIIVTHPGMGAMFTDPTIDEMKEVAAMGAYIEVVANELQRADAARIVAVIRAVGPEHCIMATDSGLVGTLNHPDALVSAAQALREAGFSEDDLTLMFKTNPAAVLGLPAL